MRLLYFSMLTWKVTLALCGESASYTYRANSLRKLSDAPPRNFRLADLVTIMNGVCGSFSIFSSARYLITNDVDYLYAALAYPLAGLMFDFFDGKVARWRKESSMIGQELDSLADLVNSKFISTLLPRCSSLLP